MAKNIVLITLLIIVLISFIYFVFYRVTPPNTTKIKLGNTQYSMEIAKTMAQKIKGLGDRTTLCSNCGMIFIFNSNSIQPFWMKDTLISLDLIWVKSDNTIVSIQTATIEHNPSNPSKIYQNSIPAKYVIEINAGDTQKLNLKIGDSINLNSINE